MISVGIPKGYNLKIDGDGNFPVVALKKPSRVAALPARIPFVKPRLLVAEGERVKIGTVLFEDKRNPDLKFLSPGGGNIHHIRYGQRRIIEEVVVDLEAEEAQESFAAVSESDLEAMSTEEVSRELLARGLWPFIRALPIRDIAPVEEKPPAIWVCMDSGERFQPLPEIYLHGKEQQLAYGIRLLAKMTDKVNVVVAEKNGGLRPDLKRLVTHVYRGRYPAGDPGVLLYHTKKNASENRCWFVGAQDLLLMAESLQRGCYVTERVIGVASGFPAAVFKHYRTRLGVPLSDMLPEKFQAEGQRLIAGGILRGTETTADGYMGLYETSLAVMPSGEGEEFFGFLRPGLNKPSFSRTFLSTLKAGPLPIDSGVHGEERACVNCGTCVKVCPVDILPQFAFKSIVADEVEESLEHGLLDCVECGLCSYVCPSKVELSKTFKEARKRYHEEQRG